MDNTLVETVKITPDRLHLWGGIIKDLRTILGLSQAYCSDKKVLGINRATFATKEKGGRTRANKKSAVHFTEQEIRILLKHFWDQSGNKIGQEGATQAFQAKLKELIEQENLEYQQHISRLKVEKPRFQNSFRQQEKGEPAYRNLNKYQKLDQATQAYKKSVLDESFVMAKHPDIRREFKELLDTVPEDSIERFSQRVETLRKLTKEHIPKE